MTDALHSSMPPVLLMAAGLGTRLRPLTADTPKCLVPVSGRSLLDYWQASFIRHHVTQVLINVHAHAQQVRDWVARRNAEGPVRWHRAEEPELLGSAGTLRENRARLEETPDFLVIYADNISEVDLSEFVRMHRERAADFTIGLFETPYPSACGIVSLDEDGSVSAFEEKPKHPKSNLANAGVYMIRSGFLEEVIRPSDFDIGHDVLPRLVHRMHGWVIDGYHRDVATPRALADIETDLAGGLAPALVPPRGDEPSVEDVARTPSKESRRGKS